VIDHDPDAIRMHLAGEGTPSPKVFDAATLPPDLVWLSPPCCHFARPGRLRRAMRGLRRVLEHLRGRLARRRVRRRLIRFAMRRYRWPKRRAALYVDAVMTSYADVVGAGKDTP
jgi:hypothetical protein